MSNRSWLLLAAGFGAVCMFGLALVLAVTFVLVSRRTVTTAAVLPEWSDPIEVANLKIDPILSVATLAGTPDATALSTMESRGELDSAYVSALFATSLSDRQRLGQLLLIGERYTAADKSAMAKRTLQAVLDLGALSPSLSDFERAEALAQAATAYYKLKDNNLAGLALDAGRDIALQSPFLKDAHRVTLISKLLRAAQQGGDSARTKKLNDDRSGFVNGDSTTPAPAEPPNPLPTIEPPAKSEALTAAESKRIATAKKIADLPKGESVPDALIEDLGNQLFAEDDVRMRTYTASSGQQTLAQKLALNRGLIEWLTLKYRVASKAYGLSIVPEWEDAADEIRAQLAKAYENLKTLRADQTIALPQTKDTPLADSYVLRLQILAGRLGLYPRFPENSLVDELNDKTGALIDAQPNTSLRVKVEVSGNKYYYHLVNDETWNGEVPATPSAKPKVTSAPTRSASTPALQATAASTKPPAAPTSASTLAPTAPPPQTTPVPPTNTAPPARPSPTPTNRPYP